MVSPVLDLSKKSLIAIYERKDRIINYSHHLGDGLAELLHFLLGDEEENARKVCKEAARFFPLRFKLLCRYAPLSILTRSLLDLALFLNHINIYKAHSRSKRTKAFGILLKKTASNMNGVSDFVNLRNFYSFHKIGGKIN